MFSDLKMPFLFFPLLCIICLTKNNYASEFDPHPKIILKISSNTEKLNACNTLEIKYTIKNNSNESYRFSTLNNILKKPLHFINEKNLMSFPWESEIIYDLDLYPKLENFYILPPNTEKKFFFKFVLESGTINILDKQYNGFFLYYPKYKAYIILGREKRLLIQGFYSASKLEIEVGKQKYGYNNIFLKKIESNILKISIKEQEFSP